MKIDVCADHWHCDPETAAHDCTAPDRSKPCPTCEEPPGPLKCDFCSAPNPSRQYRTTSFVAHSLDFLEPNTKHVSEQDWAACRRCARQIDAGHWDALVERLARKHLKQYRGSPQTQTPEYRAILYTTLHNFYREFREARLSPTSEPLSDRNTVGYDGGDKLPPPPTGRPS